MIKQSLNAATDYLKISSEIVWASNRDSHMTSNLQNNPN